MIDSTRFRRNGNIAPFCCWSLPAGKKQDKCFNSVKSKWGIMMISLFDFQAVYSSIRGIISPKKERIWFHI